MPRPAPSRTPGGPTRASEATARETHQTGSGMLSHPPLPGTDSWAREELPASACSAATRVAGPLVGGLPVSSGRHGGCRLRFDTTGALMVATGDAATGTIPQDLTSLGGKILRVYPMTGAPAAGNPRLGPQPPSSTRSTTAR